MRAERDTPREVRKLYPAEDCRAVHEVIPPACQACGASLSGQDPHPHRYQVIDLPPVTPDVVEYRLHELRCPCCDTVTRALLPLGVSAWSYGEQLTAMVALLSGAYRLSYRQVCAVMDDLSGIRLSRGGVGRLRQDISEAVSPAVDVCALAPVDGGDLLKGSAPQCLGLPQANLCRPSVKPVHAILTSPSCIRAGCPTAEAP